MKIIQTEVEEGWLSYSHIPENSPDRNLNQVLYRLFSLHSDFKGVVFNPSSGDLHYDVKLKVEIPGFKGFYYTPLDVASSEPEIVGRQIFRTFTPNNKNGEEELINLWQLISRSTSSFTFAGHKNKLVLFSKLDEGSIEVPFDYK